MEKKVDVHFYTSTYGLELFNKIKQHLTRSIEHLDLQLALGLL